VTTLAERLGRSADSRLVIICVDGLGLCQAANDGVYQSLRTGTATTGSLMVPCPWARDAASHHLGEDVGVNLTLNCEYDRYRWGPVTQAPSLLDGDGGLPRTVTDMWDHADLDEVRRECRAQIERAILWGFDVSHLQSHRNSLVGRPEFFDLYLELAVDYRLPLRLPGADAEPTIGFPFRRLAADEGVLFPDHFVTVTSPGGVGSRRAIERALFELPAGVTELHAHPAADTPELRALTGDWANRVDDLHLLVHDAAVRAMIARSGVELVTYRALRDAMRSG
jgi:chitin disaccharide deacetylase